jgi:hypothetical protein
VDKVGFCWRKRTESEFEFLGNTTSLEPLEEGLRGNGTLKSMLGDCAAPVNGYYVESVVCVLIGVGWLFWGIPTILRLQRKPRSSWRVIS